MAPQRAVYMILNILIAGLLFSMVLVTLWLHIAVRALAEGREEELATRVVLKPIIAETQAQAFADRIKKKHPDLNVTLITPAEARTLLALQEPWMKNLSEVEVASLPTTIEIRDPKALSQPQRLTALQDELRQSPETDFLVFNDFLFERFALFLASARGYARGAAVFQVHQRGDRLLDDVPAATAVHVDDEGHAARVVFVDGVVEPDGPRQVHHGSAYSVRHAAHSYVLEKSRKNQRESHRRGDQLHCWPARKNRAQ